MRSEQKVNEVLVRDVLQTNNGEVKLTQGKKTETNVNTLTCTLHSRPKWGKFIIHFHRKPQKNDSSLFSGKSLRVCRKNSQEHIETVASNIRMFNKRILPWTLAGRISHWTGLCSQGSIPTESDAISISLHVLRSSKISVPCIHSQYFIRIIAKVCSDFPIVFVFSTSRCFSYPLLQFKSNSSRLMTVSPCDLAMIWNWFPSFSSPTPLDVSYASLLSPQSVNCKEEKSDLTNN